MKKIKLIFLLSYCLLMSCINNNGEQNYEELKKIKTGMSRDDVNNLLTNSPLKIEEAYWSDTLFVESYKSVFGSSDHYKIIYRKSDSVVVEITYGD